MDPRLVSLAHAQQGLLTTAQLAEHDAETLQRERLADEEWFELQPGVLLPSTALPTPAQAREAARLSLETRKRATGIPWCFAAVTAAQLLGLRVSDETVVVAVQGSTRPALRDVVVLRARALPTLRQRNGVPVPTVPVVVVQCAAMSRRDDLVTLVEHALRERRCTLEELRKACGRGVSGAAALRSVIDELSREGRDRWVRRLVRLLVADGLPHPETERPVPLDCPQAYLDLAWWELGLAGEVDDWQSHASRDAAERDRARDRWLNTEYGLTVLRVTPREIRDRPARVVRDFVSAYRRAEAERSRRSAA